MKQRKIYSDEFKKSAVSRVNAGVSQSSVARELSISLSTLNKWIIAANKNATQDELSEHDEIVRLRKELAKTKAEVEFLKKSSSVLSQRAVGKYAYIKESLQKHQIGRRTLIPLRRAVEMLEISVSSYYHWLKADNEHRNGVVYTDAQIITAVREEIKLANDYVSGAKFFYFRLKQRGLKVAFKRLVKLMRSNGIYHRYHRKYVTTTNSSHRLPHSDILIKRDFNSFGIDEAWCGDITYIPTDEGWLYLASVIDLKSRYLIGYSFDANMTTDLISDALLKAIKESNPKYGAIFHSDQGSQYCSHKYQELLTSLGLRSSMSDRGECWDNAVAESFWATVKRENPPISGSFSSRALAKKRLLRSGFYTIMDSDHILL